LEYNNRRGMNFAVGKASRRDDTGLVELNDDATSPLYENRVSVPIH
jgi:hypothetical protein